MPRALPTAAAAPTPSIRGGGTRYAVLGMLSIGLRTGYAMKKHVEANLGHFWSESYGQLYPVLRQLEAEGLATGQEVKASGQARRMVYEITPAGLEELRAWLGSPPEPPRVRMELLLKLSFSGRVAAEVPMQQVREYRDFCEREVKDLARIEATLRSQPEPHQNQPYWLMTLRYGRAVREAEVSWCEETLAQLEGLLEE